MLRLFNTLTRKKDPFRPLKGKRVGIYTCGPTVYDFAHIGNLRSYIFADILRRSLAFLGLTPFQVMNITDVGHLTADSDTGDDKIERAAATQKKDAWELVKFYTTAFQKDAGRLNILAPDVMPRATDHIKEQISLIRLLEKRGYTYRTSDGIYFDTTRLKNYGKLARLKITGLKGGQRVTLGEKHAITDFALWKSSVPQDTRGGRATRGPGSTPIPKRQMEWPSPWGVGFPGWHIECSAMSVKYLGQPFDIHTGGIDHIAIHHTNEIAQSEAATGKPLARVWMHGEFLVIKKNTTTTRMGKSEGNLLTLQTLIDRGYDPLEYRYLCLGTHYRKLLDFSDTAMKGAATSLARLQNAIEALQSDERKETKESLTPYQKAFKTALENDLNMPRALAVLWQVLRSPLGPKAKVKLVKLFDEVLGLKLDVPRTKKESIPEEISQLATKREQARVNKDWNKADQIRAQLLKLGFSVEDTHQGPKIVHAP